MFWALHAHFFLLGFHALAGLIIGFGTSTSLAMSTNMFPRIALESLLQGLNVQARTPTAEARDRETG